MNIRIKGVTIVLLFVLLTVPLIFSTDLRYIDKIMPRTGYPINITGDVIISGDVGIGTTSPSSKLHVVGGATITNGLTVSGGTVSLPNGQINNAEISEMDWTKLQNYPTGCGAGKAIQAVGDTLTCIDVVESSNGITGSGTANRIAKFTGANTIGNSGISDSSDAVAITIDSSERVGIGTTSPVNKTHIVGTTGKTDGIFIQDPTAPTYGARFMFDDANSKVIIGSRSNGADIDHIVLNRDDGNVGIGTTSPGTTLDVNGDIRVRGADIQDAGGTSRITITDNGRLDLKEDNGNVALSINTAGNVGIGTTSPTGKLDIRGDEVRIWDGSATVNYATGQGELYVENDLEVDGVIYGDGSGITNLPSTGVEDIWVNESGDTMTGNLDMNSNDITNVNVLHAISLGVADTYTNAVNNIPTGNSLYVQDDIKVGGNIQGNSGDVAEKVHIKGDLEPGDVVVITDTLTVEKSTKAYDTAVAGIISTDPAYILAVERDGLPLALTGIVPVKVTNESGNIKPKDLLTTSSKPGYAMKCNDLEKCRGAILGKAMGYLNKSEGIIQVLVMLG